MQQQIIDPFNPVLIAYFSSQVMEAVVPFKLCGIINNEKNSVQNLNGVLF